MSAAEDKETVRKLLGSTLRTTLSDGRVVKGTFHCLDRHQNFILANAVETRTEAGGAQHTRHLRMVIVPGKHLLKVERPAQLQAEPDPVQAEDDIRSVQVQAEDDVVA